MAVKSQLGLKDLNTAAAVSAHNKIAQTYAKNPRAQLNQVFTKLSPTERKNYGDVTSQVPTSALTPNVTMSQLRRQLQLMKQLKSAQKLNNGFELEDKEQITEAVKGFKDENNPPVLIVLQRKGIRIFPDGRKVALYQNKQLGLVITIPYAGTGNTPGEIIPGANIQKEETDLDIMESIEQVAAFAQQDNVTSHAKHMKFADGSKLKVSHGAAKAIHMVHGALNDENKKKFANMLTTPKGFEKAAHFALSRVKFSIGGE